ncbi:S-adenosyl-L-methionine-dependent methyltransferase [Gamsiella multidivaricata]|uniref:S-adenosyl-L-methionine-dependent methyltransferase n=1 Tax=Gamsiella multidivaricata TaxID=101098 RepID=UPI00221E7246|nr:S-adenosyl-L-methionine-dependent methyltransferase [Gamsiella multidivaricata]KAI7817479.1 S-adenosyl-L-methionine-dependent methyltransferase [Gamsiella multidivaricata]
MHEPGVGRDDVIKSTDDDAIISKLSAVNLEYLNDPFVKHFVKRPSRRPPLINRGSYLRTAALDNLTEQFMRSVANEPTTASPTATATTTSGSKVPLSAGIRKQIVSLGCGSDTRYFNFKAKGLSVQKYFEIDFQESTAKKAAVIKKNKAFTDIIADPDLKLGLGGTELYSEDYCLLSGDLREFVDIIVPKLKAQGFDTSLPTLFLSECVLIYIQPHASDAIVDWVGKNLDASLFVVYEQINPIDAFGAMMLRNLKARQIELPGIHAYPSLKSQEERFLSRGWLAAKAVSMNTLLDDLPEDEMKRISALEIFDEVEEWQLLAGHYCIAWAYNAKAQPSGYEDERAKLISLLFNSVRFTDNSK